MNQLLIVEDDKHLNDGIRLALKKDFVCSQAYNIASAREMYHQQQYDLLLLCLLLITWRWILSVLLNLEQMIISQSRLV